MSQKRRTKALKKKEIDAPIDLSPYVFQREKINFDLKIKSLQWTEKQQKFIELALSKECKLLLVSGSAGTSKTFLSMFIGLTLLNKKRCSDIVLVRSAVESAESKLGFLPGDIGEKFNVYLTPFNDKLSELLSQQDINKLQKDERLQICPINFARGLHWAAKCVVADECQNFTTGELTTLLTRIGQFSKVILCGDPTQSDLPNGKGEGFSKICKMFSSKEAEEQGIFTFEFTDDDILRSELVKFIVKTFRNAKL